MGSLFSKKHSSLQDKITEEDRAVLGLKMQRDKLKMAYKRYENNIVKEKEMARELLRKGRKERALLLLKRKRYQETLMDRISGQLEQVERMTHDLEVAQLNREVFERLKKGNEALQVLNESFSIEEAQRIMEETEEASEYQKEISSILSFNLTEGDMQQVEEEYEQMVQEQEQTAQQTLPAVPDNELSLPVPKGKAKIKEKRIALEA